MKFRDIAVYVMIAVVIALCIWIIYHFKTESYKCLSDPYTYPIKLLEKKNLATVSCTCTIFRGESSYNFVWDRNGFNEYEAGDFISPSPITNSSIIQK